LEIPRRWEEEAGMFNAALFFSSPVLSLGVDVVWIVEDFFMVVM
jgi:hypothetical protein